MRDSLRTRLLTWHLAAVAFVVAAFAAGLVTHTWWSRLQEVDAQLAARAARVGATVVEAADGQVDVSLGPGLRYEDAPEVYHAIWTGDGRLVDRSDASITVERPSGPGARTRDRRREVVRVSPTGVMVMAGTSLTPLRRDVWALSVALGAIGATILAVSALAGWWLVGHVLAPLDRINLTARRMNEGDLSARIPVESVDTEVGQFARALNDAFDRLQTAVDRQRRFTADASHELRTPLASLSTEVQWALGRPRPVEDLRQSLEVAARAADRMQSVIERLLALARDEARPRVTATVQLDTLVQETIADVQPLAQAAGVTVTSALDPVQLDGDAQELRDAVTNVLSNAIRYNIEHGWVKVRLTITGGVRELTVTDSGIGIDAADLPRVFEPFFRGDPARSRDTGGAGLGLAVARSIVVRHGGTIDCRSTPSEGTTVTMRWA